MNPKTPVDKSLWAQLGVLYAVVIVDLIGFGVVIPILPFYAESYGASGFQLGLLLTCYSGMQFLFAPIWGRLSDRIGRRPVMLVTILGTSFALLALGFVQSLSGLFAARLLAGLFSANTSVASAYVADVTPADQRTRFMGMIGASFGIGFILGPAIGGGLAGFGYSTPMFVAAALATINFVVAFFALKEPASHELGLKAKRLDFGSTSPLVQRLCGTFFLFSMAVSQLETTFAYYMLDRFDYDARHVAAILVLMALVMVAVQGGGLKPLVLYLGERRLLISGALLLAVCFVLVPFSPTVLILLLPLAASSLGRGVSQPSMMGLVSAAASVEERGATMGLFQSSGSLARVVGPLAAGALYDHWQSAPFLLAGILMVLVVVLAVRLPDRASEVVPLAA